jgi:hypothetical protein
MGTTDPKERPRRWHVQIDTLGHERVIVPAGEIEALRVRRLIKFEYPDFFRHHEVGQPGFRLTSSFLAFPGTRKIR